MSSYTNGEVSVCDSLSDGSLSDSLSVQLVELYRPAIQNGMLMVTLLPVQQQEGTQDCGLFCIANAYSVAMGKNPRNIDYNQSTMRSHLEECFEKEELSLFPPSPVPVKRSRLRHLFVKVYCFCKRPESYDDMVECEGCSTWFHFKCVGLCSSSNTDNWKCSTCSMY